MSSRGSAAPIRSGKTRKCTEVRQARRIHDSEAEIRLRCERLESVERFERRISDQRNHGRLLHAAADLLQRETLEIDETGVVIDL
jgi:hypothetical protein